MDSRIGHPVRPACCRTGFRLARQIGAVASIATAAFACQFGAVATCHASITYSGLPNGANVSFEQVTESSTTDPEPLYGAPVVSGDSMVFNPALFDSVTMGSEMDDTSSQLSFFVQAHSGRSITSLSLAELGSLRVVGTGTDATFGRVTASGTLQVLEVDGSAIAPITVPIDLSIVGGLWQLATDGSMSMPETWSGGQSFNFDQILQNNGLSFALGATRISIELLNDLHAESEAGSSVRIEKNDFDGLRVTVVDASTDPGASANPEPTSILAFMLVAMAPWFTRHFGGR